MHTRPSDAGATMPPENPASLACHTEPFSDLRGPGDSGEWLYATLTTPQGRRLELTVSRELQDPPFTARDMQLLQTFSQSLASLHEVSSTTAAQQLPSSCAQKLASLPPRFRPILQRLLAGDGVKQVAQKLGLSPHTVHEYTKQLYRTFGVNSRGELLAQFVVHQ